MKYYKHMSMMSDDTRLKRVRRKYGLAGYGLYCLILEYISRQLEKHSPLPDLQETAEDIADEWGTDVRQINDMMVYMVNEGLFDTDYITGRIVCTKIENYLDEYIRKVPEIKAAIDNFKESAGLKLSDNVGECRTLSENIGETPDNVRQTPSRIEENRIEKSIHAPTGKPINLTTYNKLVEQFGKDKADDYIQRCADWADSKGKRYKDYAAAARNWMKKDGIQEVKREKVSTGWEWQKDAV